MSAAVQEAHAALAAKQAAERSIAQLSLCPPWRHAAFAGIMAALVVSPALPLQWRFCRDQRSLAPDGSMRGWAPRGELVSRTGPE